MVDYVEGETARSLRERLEAANEKIVDLRNTIASLQTRGLASEVEHLSEQLKKYKRFHTNIKRLVDGSAT